MPALSCVLLGVMTGAAAGAIRDVLTAQVPHVLEATRCCTGASEASGSRRLGSSSRRREDRSIGRRGSQTRVP
jgi:uncharacterized membrane protein YeiH